MSKRKVLVSSPIIGADIEVFLQDRETQEIVTAEGIIQGSKEVPFSFREGGFATSLDNVMAEFNIPPAKTSMEFYENIKIAIDYIESFIPRNLKTLAFPSARVNDKYLKTENALLFGCDPDYNAWLFGQTNPRPEAISNVRSCGGHIHVGYNQPDNNITMALIRAMDIFIGLPSIIQEPDNERKTLYGKAGAFRFKSYGGEYRTVSNYYINSKQLTEWAFNNTMQAIEFVNMESSIGYEEAVGIQTAINTNDKSLAKTLCTYFGVRLAA
jgi:hypothetical protein